MDKIQKIISTMFGALFFFIPLILWPYTSEVFEFNKIVAVYILTTLIVSAWIGRMIIEKKIIFRRTMLDIPLLVLLGSQIISTLLSIDPRTSFLGYYSRFNGGLLSTICYSLLYWAFVSNLTKRYTLISIRFLLFSVFLVSVYGVLEHFGIDKNIWVQDVQSRVFSTLGQPNWLAAWLTAIVPITWAIAVNPKIEILNSKQIQSTKFKILNIVPYALSALFFITLLFTKSRSGLLGFAVIDVIFWGLIFVNSKFRFLKTFIIYHLSFIILALAIGTQFTPSISQIVSRQDSRYETPDSSINGPALETGGTESGIIRKIVWKGALEVWKNYPLFGSGPETFAFIYYKFRPIEHNLVSEWDFIYNKAHNEYLNYAANSGTVGLLAYMVLIGFSIYQILKVRSQKLEVKNTSKNSKFESENFLFLNCDFDFCILNFALVAGYTGLLVTNFFGFSVVPTQLLFFLFPAIAVALERESGRVEEFKTKSLDSIQKIGIIISSSLALLLIYSISKYWLADLNYGKAKIYSKSDPERALASINKALGYAESEPLYQLEKGSAYAYLAILAEDRKDEQGAFNYAQEAANWAQKASQNSPANLNIVRTKFAVFIRLAAIYPQFFDPAEKTLLNILPQAPTDAKILYNLALTQARLGKTGEASDNLKRAVFLKENYKEARLAYALILIDEGKKAEAREQLVYILEKIDPDDSITKQTLEEIK